MSGLRQIGPWIATSKAFSTISPTFCHPFQRQPPQHQPIPYLPNLQIPRWSRLSCLSTWTLRFMSHPGPTTAGLSFPISPGPFTGGQVEVAPDIASPTAVWGDRLRMVAAGEPRERLEAARNFGSTPNNHIHLLPPVPILLLLPTTKSWPASCGSCSRQQRFLRLEALQIRNGVSFFFDFLDSARWKTPKDAWRDNA